MRPDGTEGDFHATGRDPDSPEIIERLLLHPSAISLPKPSRFGELKQTSGKTPSGECYEVGACALSFRRKTNENIKINGIDFVHLAFETVFCFFSDVVLQKWGRVAANFTRDQWVCLSFLMKEFGSCESVKSSADTLKAALCCSMEALTLLPGDLVLPVLTFLETLLPRVSQHRCVLKDFEILKMYVTC